MLSFEPNIVVVDDKQDEIQGILEQYGEQGIGCKFFNADLYEGDSMPDTPYSDVNLIFLDLFFSETKFDAELCSNWVQSLIPEKSFYILIIWSKDPAHAEDVIDELAKVNRLPFTFIVKNKTDFPIDSGAKYDYSKLFMEINNEAANIPSLSEIGIWKKSIKGASNIVIGNLTKNSDPSLFNAKLQKIIVGHGGTSLIESENHVYKRRVLFDALDQVLISNTRNSGLFNEIDQVNKEQLYSFNSDVTAAIDKELNSWFHFKIEKEIPNDLIIPGLICEFSEGQWKEMYSIEDDKIIENLLGKQTGEYTKITSIALLLSRPCDIAQGKYGKNLKLISGIKIQNPLRKENARQDFKFNAPKPDSVKLYDHLHIDHEQEDVALLFDFRYSFSVPEKIFIKDFPKFKSFNKELLSEMQVEYSSYSSRLGITQII